MAGNVEFDRNDESQENEAIEMNSLDESDGEETNRLNDPYLGSDVADNRTSLHHLGSDAVGNRAGLHHLGSDAVRSRAGHQRNSSTKKKYLIVVAVAFVIVAIIAITLPLVLTQNSDKNGGTDTERCNVNTVLPYKGVLVWTMTRDGLYQSFNESIVKHGILLYMNCTDGYDLKNNNSETIDMANGTCNHGTLRLPFTCQPKRCNVNDVIPYKLSQVWTMTRDGLYQSFNESMVKHGILLYMNCTDGYDLKNNNSETIDMANGTCNHGTLLLPFTCQPKRCNVNDVIPYKVSQVWTMTRDGLYQSLTDSMVEHGIMVYMDCTDGYDIKNNDGVTINMANGTCIKGTLSLPFACKPKRCNVNDVTLHKVSQVWTLTRNGRYQSLNESMVEHGILVYMNCTYGYDLINSDGQSLNMAHGTCIKGTLSLPFTCQPKHTDYADCYDIHQHTDNSTGLYYVKPHGLNETVRVMCDMDTDGGGWTVMQYRYDGSVEFYRNFISYENGFGSVTGEFWIGLRYIQAIASSATTTLRLDMEAADGDKAYQQFERFSLSEGPDYKLNLGKSSGTAGDSYGLSYHNKGQSFSTYDRDRDRNGVVNCAEEYHGAWWYGIGCGVVNLNGHYTSPGTTSNIAGRGPITWFFYSLSKRWNSLKSSKMMIRRN